MGEISMTSSERRMIRSDQDIAQRIKLARIAAGISQHELAEHIGIHKSSACRYERGMQALSPGRLVQIADFLGADLTWILRGDDVCTPGDR